MAEFTVLLVDDETKYVSLMAERLAMHDIEAYVANNGMEALQRLEEIEPDMIVLDVVMPGIGGIETLKRIREVMPRTPVILLTGRGETKEGIEGMRLGAFDYLNKPIKLEDLIKKMREALRSSAED
ncbi:response regulator [Desulfohalovibrio reitneri]|uniref:response regulator n=1 Tax=Desulfohalovibrio reitneri TaxID=1307759 RepID=UPI0004A747EB|nr:response regulator [Desulfohalovibrio reitneri]